MTATRQPPAAMKATPPPDLEKMLRDLRTVMRRWEAGARRQEELTAERDRVIRDAHAAGMTPTQLKAETGLSTQRIDQIRRGARL